VEALELPWLDAFDQSFSSGPCFLSAGLLYGHRFEWTKGTDPDELGIEGMSTTTTQKAQSSKNVDDVVNSAPGCR
jgi:hypothetical protein